MDTKSAPVFAAPLMKTLNDTVAPMNRPHLLLESPLLVSAMAAHAQHLSKEEFLKKATEAFDWVEQETTH